MNDSLEKTDTPTRVASRLRSVVDSAGTLSPKAPSVDRTVLYRIAILAVLFACLHFGLLDWMVRSWFRNPNWSHGFLIPLFSVYLIYCRWGQIRQRRARPFLAAFPLMILLLGVEIAVMSIPGLRNYWLYGLAMVAMLLALVLFLAGPALLRLLWLPVAFLALAVPLPESLYTRLAYPLQEFAAAGAVGGLSMLGVEITRRASTLYLTSVNHVTHELTVAEACSGMRLLMAFVALGIATAYLEARPLWQRLVLVAAALPIAIFCNVLRVAITCTMYYIDRPEWGQGFLHNFTGMLMLIPAFAMLWGLGYLLNRLFIEVEDDSDDTPREESPKTEGETV